ncbi:MAG: hypothetical protein D6681_22435 [Calditrichaeota bacterium]|nr:MAG: hypothetical protein D6681_22435 [Calditrichota bacterium]
MLKLIGVWVCIAFTRAEAGSTPPDTLAVDTTRHGSVTVTAQASPTINMFSFAGTLTEPEQRAYRADFFSLSLLQRGRLATGAFRGMPPGFYRFRYAGNVFTNPVTGFWDEQWIPHYRIAGRSPWNVTGEAYEPPHPFTRKPETRVVFSQDYIIDLSFVDVNFVKRFSPRNYVQLSGANFLGDGTDVQDFSRFSLNPYHAQVHLERGELWKADLFYWQIRHRFNIRTAPLAFTRDKFKIVSHLLWAQVQGRFSDRDSLSFVPAYTTVRDEYTRIQDKQRDLSYRWGQIFADYRRKLGQGIALGLEMWGQSRQIRGRRFWPERWEQEGRAALFLNAAGRGLELAVRGGWFHHTTGGTRGLGSVHLRLMGGRWSVEAAAFTRPRATPMLWRTVQQDTFPRLTSSQLMREEGASFSLTTAPVSWFKIQVEPFAYRTRGYPVPDADAWRFLTVENRGVRLRGEVSLWNITLQNDFVYNHNYREAFAPRLQNITMLDVQVPLFGGALLAEGALMWRYWDRFRTVDFDRWIYHYRLSETMGGPFGVGDGRIMAHFRDATVFFVWENFLSQDYAIVNGTVENLAVFRLGIDWFLFN